jgi:hypothetical protein
MSRMRISQPVFVLLLIVFLLIGCSGSAPETPHPGAALWGPMEISKRGSNASAEGGTVSVTVTDDGTGIAKAGY